MTQACALAGTDDAARDAFLVLQHAPGYPSKLSLGSGLSCLERCTLNPIIRPHVLKLV